MHKRLNTLEAESMQFTRSNELRIKAHQCIPGGCHTYAKGDDQYPELSPGFIVRGKGSRVWDVDGNEYIEYGQGNRSVGLGHAFPAVVEAAQRAMADGTNFSRPALIELEAAETLLSMVSECRHGQVLQRWIRCHDRSAKISEGLHWTRFGGMLP